MPHNNMTQGTFSTTNSDHRNRRILCMEGARWTGCLAIHFLFIGVLAVSAGPVTAGAQAYVASPIPGVLGKVESVTNTSVEVQTKNGAVRAVTEQPLTIYRQVPSTLSQGTASSYVGIPSAKQKDGTEVAKQIMIFPKEPQGVVGAGVAYRLPRVESGAIEVRFTSVDRHHRPSDAFSLL